MPARDINMRGLSCVGNIRGPSQGWWWVPSEGSLWNQIDWSRQRLTDRRAPSVHQHGTVRTDLTSWLPRNLSIFISAIHPEQCQACWRAGRRARALRRRAHWGPVVSTRRGSPAAPAGLLCQTSATASSFSVNGVVSSPIALGGWRGGCPYTCSGGAGLSSRRGLQLNQEPQHCRRLLLGRTTHGPLPATLGMENKEDPARQTSEERSEAEPSLDEQLHDARLEGSNAPDRLQTPAAVWLPFSESPHSQDVGREAVRIAGAAVIGAGGGGYGVRQWWTRCPPGSPAPHCARSLKRSSPHTRRPRTRGPLAAGAGAGSAPGAGACGACCPAGCCTRCSRG